MPTPARESFRKARPDAEHLPAAADGLHARPKTSRTIPCSGDCCSPGSGASTPSGLRASGTTFIVATLFFMAFGSISLDQQWYVAVHLCLRPLDDGVCRDVGGQAARHAARTHAGRISAGETLPVEIEVDGARAAERWPDRAAGPAAARGGRRAGGGRRACRS